MTLNYNKMIKVMATAFQEATFQPITWVDAKRGTEAAFKAMQGQLPHIPCGHYSECAREEITQVYNELKNLQEKEDE